jgi:hypothetical protein
MRTLLSSIVLIGSAAVLATAQEAAQLAAPSPKVLLAPARAPSDMSVETQGESRREASGSASGSRKKASPQQPLISFIDSPSSTCYQPDPRRDACFITWYYLSVDANPNYMISLWLFLNDFGLVSQTQGFFQTSMYVPYNMLGQGFRVACGPPVDDTTTIPGTTITHGNQYAYTIRAKDSADLKSANYGSVTCPAFIPAP